ncbi:MAG: DUF86 domain-containing protein [Verrucomicrobiia bacterium]
MPDDVTLAKVEIIERCLRRISEVYAGNAANLFNDFTKQDSILLNLERACQAAIDLALHFVPHFVQHFVEPGFENLESQISNLKSSAQLPTKHTNHTNLMGYWLLVVGSWGRSAGLQPAWGLGTERRFVTGLGAKR